MAVNQNVVEEALFQIKNLEETLQENAKGILQSTMSEEIKQLVKESLKEAKDEEIEEQDEPEMGFEDELDTETEVEDEDMDDEMESEDEMEFEMDDEEMDFDDEEETIDLTTASDEEVLRVFKAMGDEDGIVVKKEGENIHFTDGDNEYMIQLGESEMEDELYEIEDEMDFEMDEEMEMDFEDEMMEQDDEDEMEEGWSWGGAATGAIKGGLGLDEEMDMEDDEVEETIYEIEMEDEMEDEMDETIYEIEMEDEMMEEEDEDEMMEEEDDMDSIMEAIKKSITPKGVGIGKGPKFGYDKKPNMSGGFSEKKKEAFGKGVKAVGTGKAKFEYKEEKHFGSNKHEYKRKKVDGVEKKAGDVKGHYKTYEKKETKEAARTYGNGSKDGSRGLRKARLNNRNYEYNPFKLSESQVQNEVSLLREKNEEYKKALDVFRTKLNEVAVFNSNLAYATRLFTEHSTTKQEKINILKRFDGVESLKESKNLYRAIKNELSSTNSSNGDQKLNESIERKVNNSVQTGSSTNLIESKTYENPQFLRMKDLMSKI
jgi:HIV Tat-specific factor 1